MKLKGLAIIAPLLFFTSHAPAQDETLSPEQQEAIRVIAEQINMTCTLPAAPVVPDGNTASEDDMISTQQALKTYIEDGNTYLGCLEEVEAEWGEDASENQTAVVNFLYNRMVSDLQSRAKAFNAALGVYREKSAQ